jgi:Tannase-like family of unknown function (DUF6351)
MNFSPHFRVALQSALRRPSVAAIVTAAALVACGGSDEQVAVSLSIESSDAQWVSGGEALVRARAELAQGRSVKVSVNGTTVAVDWKADPADSSSRLGVVSGLAVGQNTLAAEVMAGSVVLGKTTMQVRNHPRTGPMFSGSHETPFICETQRFRVFAGGPLLGDPLDANCSIATRVDYVYRRAG